MEYNQIIQGDSLTVLKTLPDESVNCCVTSPPYWGLRDYGIEPIIWDGIEGCGHKWGNEKIKPLNLQAGNPEFKRNWREQASNNNSSQGNFCLLCSAWRGSLGFEPIFELYIKHLCDIFDEVKRVLRKDGTCWVNLGDSYGGGGNNRGSSEDNNLSEKQFSNRGARGQVQNQWTKDYPTKSLCLIPQRFAIEMVNRDTMDIYELDKGIIICNNIDITNNNIGGKYAIQRPDKSKRIQYEISKEMERGTQGTVSKENEGMAREEQRESKSIQQETLLDSSRTGNNASNEGECQKTQEIKNGSNDEIWRKSSEVCLLWGNDLSVFNNRPYQRENEGTQSRSNKMWLNLRMVKENELSTRFQSFMYELQLGNREIWILPPSRGKNLCLRKRDIPIELLPLFKLKEEERWRLRNTIIWHKPNCIPSSAKDRFTVDFEYVYFFVKSKKYWFERQFEGLQGNEYDINRMRTKPNYNNKTNQTAVIGRATSKNIEQGRNKRCVWTIPTQPFSGSHFAVFPEKLIETPIQAGCPQYVCKKCGKGREKIIETNYIIHKETPDPKKITPEGRQANNFGSMRYAKASSIHTEKGYTDCGCNAGWEGGIVLDPFGGALTTCVVAKKQGKRYIAIEIKPEYIEMGRKRLRKIAERLF